jgi:hypothetical protein
MKNLSASFKDTTSPARIIILPLMPGQHLRVLYTTRFGCNSEDWVVVVSNTFGPYKQTFFWRVSNRLFVYVCLTRLAFPKRE